MVTPNEVKSRKDCGYSKSQGLGYSKTRKPQEVPLLPPVEGGIWTHIKESGFYPKGKAQW